jgi:hypothetical protein
MTTQARASEPVGCLNEIRKADALIQTLVQKQAPDSVSAQAASHATQVCQTDLTEKESALFDELGNRCREAYGNSAGTTNQVMMAICEMNAVRYVLSLQVDLNATN